MFVNSKFLKFLIWLTTVVVCFILWQQTDWSLSMLDVSCRNHSTPVLVTVFYEALCPDSKYFLIKQLVPAYKTAPDMMIIKLVPYGKATTSENIDGSYHFECQHGIAECQSNIYHACVIEHVKDQGTQLNFISCMIMAHHGSGNPKDTFIKCAGEHKLEDGVSRSIQNCYHSSYGNRLLKLNGDETHALRPKITFIPTVTLDGSQEKQSDILKNFLLALCKFIEANPNHNDVCSIFS